MKYIITHKQYQLLSEQTEEVLKLPSVDYFGGWDNLQTYLASKNNPPYSIEDELDLANSNVKSLGNLVSVKGNLHLNGSEIESLGNLTHVGGDFSVYDTKKLKSLSNLTTVGGDLGLGMTKVEDFGNLKKVGGDLDLGGCWILLHYRSPKKIRSMVDVGGEVKTKI